MTRTKIIDLMPFIMAFSLGMCTVLSSAGCAEERARAETGKTKEPTDTLQAALDATAPKTVHADAPKSEPVVAEAQPEEPKPESPRPVYEANLAEGDGIYLNRLKTASSIENREPVMETSSFDLNAERIYVFMDVRNDTDEEKDLIVNFIGPDQRVRGGIELQIPASVPRWRTWVYTRKIKANGEWLAEVRLSDGTLLGSVPFEVY